MNVHGSVSHERHSLLLTLNRSVASGCSERCCCDLHHSIIREESILCCHPQDFLPSFSISLFPSSLGEEDALRAPSRRQGLLTQTCRLGRTSPLPVYFPHLAQDESGWGGNQSFPFPRKRGKQQNREKELEHKGKKASVSPRLSSRGFVLTSRTDIDFFRSSSILPSLFYVQSLFSSLFYQILVSNFCIAFIATTSVVYLFWNLFFCSCL